jgi:glucose/arabinose dehydrogenase
MPAWGSSAAAIGIVLVTACGSREPERREAVLPDSALPLPRNPSPALAVDTIAANLEVPWDVGFLPDGRILITERAGRIRVVEAGALRAEPWAAFEVEPWNPGLDREAGLMGLAVAPDFAQSGAVYVQLTRWRGAGDGANRATTRLWRKVAGAFDAETGFSLENRIVRLTDRDGRGIDPTVIVAGLVTGRFHAGGALGFGPDGMLYASVGDGIQPALAPRPDLPVGKILRFRPDGSIPADNPIPGSPVFARGFRNSQAFDWLADGAMLAVDHGPTGMRQERLRVGQDELNLIRRGRDYGWPTATGWRLRDSLRFEAPIWVWQKGIAPAGMTVYDGSVAAWAGNVFVAGLKQRLERLELEASGGHWRVTGRESLLEGQLGRIRAVRVGPDGSLYLTTSNRDNRGSARLHDDLLVRVRPLLNR